MKHFTVNYLILSVAVTTPQHFVFQNSEETSLTETCAVNSRCVTRGEPSPTETMTLQLTG